MVKSRTRKCSANARSEDDSSSQASSEYELELVPPIVPEPPEPYDETSDVTIEVPHSEEIMVVDMRRVKERIKRLLATGRLDLFARWIREVTYFGGSDKAIRRPRAFAFRGAVLNQFTILFPGYMPPSGSMSTYVPIFREELGEDYTLPDAMARWTSTRRDFYEALRLKQPSMKNYLRGSLIHPALGVFAGKDASVFQWDVTAPYTTALFNRRSFTPEELSWPAFYPLLSRVRILIHDQAVDIWSEQGVSPQDEFGYTYLSVKDILVAISSFAHSSISPSTWCQFELQTKVTAIILHSKRTGMTIDVEEEEEDEAAQLAKVAAWLPLPPDIVADPIDNHPFGKDDCEGCVQCCEDIHHEVLHRYADKYFAPLEDDPITEPDRMITFDSIPIQPWFRGLVNVGPYTYFLETEK